MAMSGGLIAQGKLKEATISAVITRANGTVENLGVITYWHKNFLKRWLWETKNWFINKVFTGN